MAVRSARSWSPKATTPRTSSIVSTLFFSSSFSLSQSRRNPGILRLRYSSSSSPPPPKIRPIPPSAAAAANKRSKRSLPGFNPSASEAADGPLISPLRPTPNPPLWRRILASKRFRSIISLNIVIVIFASNIAIVKEAEVIIDPAVFNLVRFTVLAIPFIPFVLKEWEDHDIRATGMELGFWLSLGYLTQAFGLLTSDAGRASFISAFTVIVVPLVDGLFGSLVPAHTWFGAVATLTGVGMLECSGSPPCVGDILNLLSAIFFGIHMLRTEHISKSTKKEKHFVLLGYEVCVLALLSTMWFFCRGIFGDMHHFSFKSWSWTMLRDWMVLFPWVPALYTGIFSTGLCLWAELAAMCDISATETAMIYGLEPVWGAAFAWVLLGERWGTTGWIGAALVLCGSLSVQILGSLTKKAKRHKSSSFCNYLNVLGEKNDDASFSTGAVN